MNKSDQKIFVSLFFSLFATIIGVGIVVPLLPVYAHDLGASGVYIGAIFASFSISRTILLPFFGRMSDKRGRKPFIVGGLFAYALVSVAFLLIKDVKGLIAIRFIQGAASAMIMPVVQAYVGDITPKGKEGFYMGLFNISVFLGLGVGPLMGGVIKDRFSLQAAFGCMGALAVIGFLSAALLLPPTRSERSDGIEIEPPAWRTLLLDREIAGLFFFRFAYTACIGVIWGFLPVFADAEFSMDSSSIGVLLMLGILLSGLIQTPMGWLADRIDKRAMAMTGGLIVCCAVYSFVWAGGFWDMMLSSIAFGLGGGISMPSLMAAAVIKGSDRGAMGAVIALLTMGHSSGMLLGALMAGLMMDISQLRDVFPFGAGLMLLGVGVFYFCVQKKPGG